MLRIAIYIRLSSEDGDLCENTGKTESVSVENQRKFIREYISKCREFQNVVITEYCDDGYTGRNFDRPGFQCMIEAAKKKELDCIIVKDASRLGRNYVEVGNLMEQVFPFLGIRFISINDDYDSNQYAGTTGGVEVAFQNLIYKLYSTDLGRKVSSAMQTRQKRGEYLSPFAIYGYQKSDEDIHKLVIDEESAVIVRRIFMEVIDRVSRIKIASRLNAEGVPTPAIYKQKKNCTRDWQPDKKLAGWTSSAIARIIREERYVGHMVSHKSRYDIPGVKHQVRLEKKEWFVVKNTHEGIVSQEEFELANKMMHTRDNSTRVYETKPVYSVIRCPYCGLTLKPTRKGDKLICRTKNANASLQCHSIRVDSEEIYNAVLVAIRNQAMLFVEVEKILKSKQNRGQLKTIGNNLKLLEREKTRISQDKMKAYEEYRDGRTSREDFVSQRATLMKREEEIMVQIGSIQKELEIKEIDTDTQQMLERITRYIHMESYDKKVAAELIDKVIVYDESSIQIYWKNSDAYEKILNKINA